MQNMTLKKNSFSFLLIAAAFVIAFSILLFGSTVNIAEASSNQCWGDTPPGWYNDGVTMGGYTCSNGSWILAGGGSGSDCTLTYNQTYQYWIAGDIEMTMVKTDSSHVQTTVINKTNCSFPAVTASFKVYDNKITGGIPQTMIGFEEQTISGKSTYVFTSDIASCLTQVDIWYPGAEGWGWLGKIFGTDGSVFGSIPEARGTFCTQDTPEDPDLSGSCSVSPSTADINETVNWSASASGGTGSYTYSWSGTDSLSGSGSAVSKSYSSSGSKTGTVTITSGSQSVVKSCTVTVEAPSNNALSGACSVSPSNVNVGSYINWSASASGGTGSYTYSWSGTDSLSANSSSVSQAYFSTGTKTGTVTITSGSESVVRSCTATVTEEDEDQDLNVTCSVDDSSVDIDEDVTWSSSASGGNGSYTYAWEGTDDLHGHSHDLTWSYDDNGTKNATITVTSDGQTASATCHTHVAEEDNNDLSVSCYASPSNPQIGNSMKWYVQVSGGDGDYDYDWSGTNGLNSSSKSPSMTYTSPGNKNATVTVTDGDGQEDSDTCYVTLNSVLSFSQTNQPPLASAVYLSQIPYTGVADNMKLVWYILGLGIFSAWIAYIIIERKKQVGELN